MPRKSRSDEQVKQVKENILKHALQIIQEKGLEALTMRALAGRLGVRATTIYSYFESKDHLYLAVLTRGFQLLYIDCESACKSEKAPLARLQAMMKAYLKFGLEQANFYNLMFTWHVPKYRDYVGTPMEAAAQYELEESQKVYLLFIRAAMELGRTLGPVSESEAREYIIHFWSALHGYIAGVNNHLLTYMHEDPLALQDKILSALFDFIQSEIKARSGKRPAPGRRGPSKRRKK